MSYMSAHNRNREVRGRAADQVCPCGKPARDWAYQGSINERVDKWGAYSDDPFDYMAMCKHCHQVLDKSRITHCPHGHEYDQENTLIDAGKRKCKTCVYARNRRRPVSPAEKVRKLELQRIRRAKARSERAA